MDRNRLTAHASVIGYPVVVVSGNGRNGSTIAVTTSVISESHTLAAHTRNAVATSLGGKSRRCFVLPTDTSGFRAVASLETSRLQNTGDVPVHLGSQGGTLPVLPNGNLRAALVIQNVSVNHRLEQILVVQRGKRCRLILLNQRTLAAALATGTDFEEVRNTLDHSVLIASASAVVKRTGDIFGRPCHPLCLFLRQEITTVARF
jgi:hypothetical protein